jgi:hypothetical protein
MLSPLRNRFGIPGVIAVIALVFAMLGGAYAASNNGGGGKATASAKAKRGPKGPKGATGPQGPQGPIGPQGPAGAKGDKGDPGATGAAGPAGTAGATGATGAAGPKGDPGGSILVGEFTGPEETPPNAGPCSGRGGSEFEPEDGGGSVVYACNGAEGDKGSPWTAGGTLPSGETETGAWAFSGGEGEEVYTPISFTIPLAAALDKEHTHFQTQANFADFDEAGPETVGCKGTGGPAPFPVFVPPSAPPGHLCVYQSGNSTNVLNATFKGFERPTFNEAQGATPAGIALVFTIGVAEPSGHGGGVWAVTAP